MMEWADPVLHRLWVRTGDAARAQHLTRQVFLRALHLAGPEVPAIADLFQLAERLTPGGQRRSDAPWEAGLLRLPLRDRRVGWLALYGRWSFEDLAAAENLSAVALMASLGRLARVMGQPLPPDDEGAWRRWLAEHGPPPLPAGAGFRWRDWDPRAPVERTRRIRPRHVLVALAGALVLGGWVWHTEAARRAAIPRLPFAEQPATTMFHIVVAHGVPVQRRPFGSTSAAPVPGARLTAAFTRYDIATTSPGHPTRAYQVGSLQVAWVRNQAGVGLIVADPTGAPVSVVNLASGGGAVHATAEPGYRVYGFDGLAGAVRITEDGHHTIVAWAAGLNEGIESGAWSVATERRPRGPEGGRAYAAPPGPGIAVGVLADGVLWQTKSGWWLLPPSGPPLPLILQPGGASAPHQFASLWPPYPGASNEVLAYEYWQSIGGGPSNIWWNLASERMGVVSSGFGAAGGLPVSVGWVSDSGAGVLDTYASPPAHVALPASAIALAAWGHSVFVQQWRRGAPWRTGTYSWAHRTWTLAHVVQTTEWQVAALPHWGPTYVDVVGQDMMNREGVPLSGPCTVRFVSATGRERAAVALPRGSILTAGARWVVMASSQHPNQVRAAWPDAAGRLTWHVVQAPAGAVIHQNAQFLYWTAGGHTYTWVPPFQPY